MAKVTKGKIDDLKQDSRNANLHSEQGTLMLDKSLNELGAGRSVLVSSSNELIAGNGVAERAKQAGIENIVIVETDGKELVVVKRTDIESGSPEFYKMALADNIVAKHNIVMNAETMEALAESVEGVAEWVAFEIDEPASDKQNPTTEDNFEERVILNPVSKLGDFYELNTHRVYCADSKDPQAVDKLLGEAVPDLVFLDPPYGNGGTMASSGYGRGNLGRRKIKGDGTTADAIAGCNNAFPKLKNNSHFLCFIQWRTYSELEAALKALGVKIKSVIIWDKKQPGLGAGVTEQYEMIIVGIKGKAVQRFFTGNVWQIARVAGTREENEHPHKKPVELIAKGMDLCIDKGTLVLELFLGSGTTLIACDQTERVCFGQELEPANVDNIVMRWLKYRLENGLPVERLKRNGKTVLKEFEKLLNGSN